MKKIFCALLLFSSLHAFAQPASIRWSIKVERKDDHHFNIIAEGQVKDGWNVYSEADKSLDLTGITLDWPNENIARADLLVTTGKTFLYEDPIFSKKLKVFANQINIVQPIVIHDNAPASVMVTIHAFASHNDEFSPVDVTQAVEVPGGVVTRDELKLSSVDLLKPAANCGNHEANGKGLLSIFLIGFGAGLLALLTPCIFPMIPVTVSFFTGRAKTRRQGIQNGLTYGLFIFLIYTIASLPFHLIGNIKPEIFNSISTNAWVNVFFFVVFVAFALSFFGLFEITLPSSMSNAAGSRSGIFFMALTLTIVSFSCTGIILGTLLVNALSKNGSAWQLTAGMSGFGAALALPFALFAMFPQWLQKLPKSGAWLDRVKKTLAFIELALAIKFLSNADLVEHWGILKREVFIGLWLIIALLLACYLFGLFDRRKQRSSSFVAATTKRTPFARFVLAALCLCLAGYLSLGLLPDDNANLKLLSGLAPPLGYTVYGKNVHRQKVLSPVVVNDYGKALQLSKEQNKPILIDFTGWACVNCRKMEEQVWTKTSIKSMINDHYILVSLYVDDRKKFPDGTTVGDKWAAFEAQNFQQVTQPLYAVLSPDEKLMNFPVGYTPDEQTYLAWLQCGLDAFKNNQTAKK